MRKLISSFILGIAVLCFSSPAHAEWVYVLVDFEEYAGAIGGNSAWGGRPGYDSVVPFPDSPGFVKTDGPDLWGFFPTTQTQYTSNGATFNHFNGSDDMFGMNFWSGVRSIISVDTMSGLIGGSGAESDFRPERTPR